MSRAEPPIQLRFLQMANTTLRISVLQVFFLRKESRAKDISRVISFLVQIEVSTSIYTATRMLSSEVKPLVMTSNRVQQTRPTHQQTMMVHSRAPIRCGMPTKQQSVMAVSA